MKRALLGFAIFLISFGLGWSVSSVFSEVDLNPERPVDVPAIESPGSELPVLLTDIDAEFDDKIDYAKRMKVKLLQASDFHSDEVPYRTGEKWLALFKDGDTYALASTKIHIKRGPDKDSDKTVTTERKGESLFLLRGASNLREGVVRTVYDDTDNDTDSYFQGNEEKTYEFDGVNYVLKLENAAEGFLQKNSLLVLESGGNRQVLRHLPSGCNDCSWSVEWVGDLDNDGRLDFLLDLNGHYNAYEPTLLLSSKAKKGKLLGILAGFHVVGC